TPGPSPTRTPATRKAMIEPTPSRPKTSRQNDIRPRSPIAAVRNAVTSKCNYHLPPTDRFPELTLARGNKRQVLPTGVAVGAPRQVSSMVNAMAISVGPMNRPRKPNATKPPNTPRIVRLSGISTPTPIKKGLMKLSVTVKTRPQKIMKMPQPCVREDFSVRQHRPSCRLQYLEDC